jgi:hypothetical protein
LSSPPSATCRSTRPIEVTYVGPGRRRCVSKAGSPQRVRVRRRWPPATLDTPALPRRVTARPGLLNYPSETIRSHRLCPASVMVAIAPVTIVCL